MDNKTRLKDGQFPETALIAVTYRCNSKCLTCNIWKDKQGLAKEMEPEIFAKLPKTLRSIDITGGEPFLRDDLAEVLEILSKSCPKARILINTNGLLPEKIAKTVSKLIRVKKDLAIRVSLDGVGKKHDQVRGIKGAYKKAVETVDRLIEVKVKDLGITFTLTKFNQGEVKKVLSFCKNRKLNFSLNLVHGSTVCFGGEKINLRPNISVIKKTAFLICKSLIPSSRPSNWAKAWFYWQLPSYAKTGKRPVCCGAGESFFYLEPNGDVSFCHFKPWKIGNLKKDSFSKIWSSRKRKLLNLSRACDDCFVLCTTKTEIKKRPWAMFKKRS